MKLGVSLIVLILAAFPALGLAEFYRYVDKEGNACYTDDLSNVPAEQRTKVDEYEELYIQPAPEKKSEKKKKTEIIKQQEGTSKEPLSKKDEEGTKEERLNKAGAKLQAQYQVLMKEREQLDKATKSPLTRDERREFAEKIREFNARIKEHEKARQAFDNEVEAYNASIEEEAEPPQGEI
jgi:hypothetical protein